jgi:Recombinase
MDEDPAPERKCEIWVQDLADRNLFHNRSMDVRLPEAALRDRPNTVIKIMYDRGLSRVLPFGYFWEVDDQIGIDPAESDVVRMVFELRGRGFSAEKIAKHLEGAAPPRGGDIWRSSRIREILDNESTYRTGLLRSDSSLHLPPIVK